MHGISLGASKKDFNFVFASLSTGKNANGNHSTPDLTNVEEVWTGFIHDRLAAFEIDYVRETEWKNVRQFAEYAERKLKLPVDAWVFIGTTEAVMECRGFKAALSSVRNTLSLTDTIAKRSAQMEQKVGPVQGAKRSY